MFNFLKTLWSMIMSLLDKAKKVDAGVDALKAQLAAKDAVIADLQAQLAEVPQVADVLDQALAKLG